MCGYLSVSYDVVTPSLLVAENYLGHSVLAPVGRWQKGRDLLWYAKEGGASVGVRERAMRDELERVRQQDEDLIHEALGIVKKKRTFEQPQLEQAEIKQLFARGGREIDTGEGGQARSSCKEVAQQE